MGGKKINQAHLVSVSNNIFKALARDLKRVRELNWLYFFFLFYRNKPNKGNLLTVAGEKCFRPGKDSGYPVQDRGVWDHIWGQETLSLE